MDGSHPMTEDEVGELARMAGERDLLRARVAELEAITGMDELAHARALCERWPGVFAFDPGHGGLRFVPDAGPAQSRWLHGVFNEHDGETLAGLLNLPRLLVQRAAARAQISEGSSVIAALVAERDAAHALTRDLENRVAELTAALAAARRPA